MALMLLWGLFAVQAAAGSVAALTVADGSRAAPILHVAVISVLLATCLLPFAARSSTQPSRSSRLLFGVVFGTGQVALLLFHVATVLGYRSWQGPLTFSLSQAYLTSLPDLLRIVGLSPAGVGALLLSAWVAACAAFTRWARPCLVALARWRQRRRGRVAGDARQPRSRWWQLVTVVYVCAGLVYGATRPLWVTREPLHIALNDDWSQGHSAPLSLFVNYSAGVRAPTPLPTTSTGAAPRPLVLIMIDALRSDQMGVYGAERETTPFLSSLWRQGRLQRVDRAYSVCTVSFCGILGTLASRSFTGLDRPPVTLPDLLAPLGYHTTYALGGDHRRFSILASLYGHHVDRYIDGGLLGGASLHDDVALVEALERAFTRPQPASFLYVHLMSVHALGTRHAAYRRWQPDQSAWLDRWRAPERQREAYRNRYHNGVLQADAMVARIFRLLERHQLLDDALIVITADHGEWLGEGGAYAHGGGPYEALTRVPLLVHDRRATYPPRSIASQLDVAPTLLAGIGVPAPSAFMGVPLQQRAVRAGVAIASRDTTGVVAEVAGVTYKYIAHVDGREELFALDDGEGDSANLAANPMHAAALSHLRRAHAAP